MPDKTLPLAEVRARLASPGGWGVHGSSADHQRYLHRLAGPGGRRKCHCGCGQRVTHNGCANGVALTAGCELSMRRWARGSVKSS